MRKVSFIILALLVGLFMAGCVPKNTSQQSFDEFAFDEEGPVQFTAEQHEQVGDGYMRRNRPEMAFVHYNKALVLDAENLDVRVKKGDLLVAQGLDEQALAEFNRVMEKDPDHAQANESAGGVYFRAGLYTEARTHLEKSVRLNPVMWKAHNYLGILYDREAKYEMAVKHFALALDLHNGAGTDEIFNNLGVVHIARKQYERAVDSFRRALKSGGVSARTYNNLGLALTRLGRLDEALESFKYAGGESKANNNVGYVLLSDGQATKAIPYFERAIELSPKYYVKAAENLKRARLAARFEANNNRGSTPNPLPGQSFPDSGQNPGGPAATPASAGSPSPKAFQKTSLETGSGDTIDMKQYGLHVSSWRDHDWAFDHCAKLKNKGYETWINQVDLGDKGIWYRVLVGRFASVAEASAARPDLLNDLELKRAPVFKLVRPVPDGSHLL